MKTVLRLLGFLRPFVGEVCLSVLLGTATVACGIGLLGTSAFLIATAAMHPGIAVLGVAIVGVRFFGISRGVLRYLERLVSHSSNFRLLSGLRVWFYERIEPLSLAKLETQRGGDLLNRAVGDIEVLEDFYVRLVAPPLVALLITLGTSLFIGTRTLILGGIVAGGMLVGGLLLTALVFITVRPLGQKISQVRSKLNVNLLEAFQGMTEWSAYGRELEQISRIRNAGREYDEIQARLNTIGAGGAAVGLFNQHLWVWLLVVAGIPLVRSGAIDGVSLAVFALMTGAAFEAVLPLNQAAQQLEGALQSARRLFDLAISEPAVADPVAPKLAPEDFHIRVDHLSFQYPGTSNRVLEDLSLDLPIGKRIAVVGPSGAGKSTLINLWLRFWEPAPGTIMIGGQDICDLQMESVRSRIAVIPQSTYLFSGSLEDNLRLANPKATQDQILRALNLAGLDGLLSRLPNGVRSWVGAQGEQLSGGERQRIACARAFLKQADLLVMDEPTANLDAITARELMAVLFREMEKCSVLWITHDLTGLAAMNEIIVLREGRVIERGTPQELTVSGGWYAQALELQKSILY